MVVSLLLLLEDDDTVLGYLLEPIPRLLVFDNKIRVLSFFVKIFGRETRNPIKIRNNKFMKLRRER